jgi:hypothetical protein
MSKQKMVHFITTRLYDIVQQLSIAAYTSKIKNKYFDFDSYFELSFINSVKYSLECLEIKDYELYREIYYKYLSEVYNLSIESVDIFMKFGILNRTRLNDYWVINKNNFLKDVVFIYENNK